MLRSVPTGRSVSDEHGDPAFLCRVAELDVIALLADLHPAVSLDPGNDGTAVHVFS